MEKLVFDYDVFEKGAGRIYQILIYCTLPALFLGVAMIAIINSGGMTHFGDYPDWVKMIFMLIVAIYVVPSLFILPTVWMLRSWKTSALKESYICGGLIQEKEDVLNALASGATAISTTCSDVWFM